MDPGVHTAIDRLVDNDTLTSAWNGANPLKLGAYTIWVDGTGDLRIVSGSPSGDTDGAIVGTQS